MRNVSAYFQVIIWDRLIYVRNPLYCVPHICNAPICNLILQVQKVIIVEFKAENI